MRLIDNVAKSLDKSVYCLTSLSLTSKSLYFTQNEEGYYI